MSKKILFTIILSWFISELVFSQSRLTPKQNYAVQVRKIIEEQSVVEQVPEYPRGFEALYDYIQSNLKYPKKARKMGKEGKVLVSFIIDKVDGHVRDATIILGADDLLNQEALRLIKSMPKWIPGKQDGRNVDVQLSIPVSFRLTNE